VVSILADDHSAYRRFRDWCGAAVTLRRLHGWATLAWLVMAIPAVLWWRSSLPFLVFVSVYANVAGHWSSWQASRVEVKAEEAVGGMTIGCDDVVAAPSEMQ
jgi:hypothetical protein